MTNTGRTSRTTRSASRRAEAASNTGSEPSVSRNGHENITHSRRRPTTRTQVIIETSSDNDSTSDDDTDTAPTASQQASSVDSNDSDRENVSHAQHNIPNEYISPVQRNRRTPPYGLGPVETQNLNGVPNEPHSGTGSEGRSSSRDDGLGDEEHRRLINAQIQRNSMFDLRDTQRLTAKEKLDQEYLLLATCGLSLSLALFLAHKRLIGISEDLQCSYFYAFKQFLFPLLQTFIWDLTQTSHAVSITVRLYWAFDHRLRYQSQNVWSSRQQSMRRKLYKNNIRICLDSLTALAAATSMVPLVLQTERVPAWWYILAYSSARGAQLMLTVLGADKRLGEVSLLGAIMLVVTCLRWYPFVTDDLATSYKYADNYRRYGGPFGGNLLGNIHALEGSHRIGHTPSIKVTQVETADDPMYTTTNVQSVVTVESTDQTSKSESESYSKVKSATETLQSEVSDFVQRNKPVDDGLSEAIKELSHHRSVLGAHLGMIKDLKRFLISAGDLKILDDETSTSFPSSPSSSSYVDEIHTPAVTSCSNGRGKGCVRHVSTVTSTTLTPTAIDPWLDPEEVTPLEKVPGPGGVTRPEMLTRPGQVTRIATIAAGQPVSPKTTTEKHSRGYVGRLWSGLTNRFKPTEDDMTTWKFGSTTITTWRFRNEHSDKESE